MRKFLQNQISNIINLKESVLLAYCTLNYAFFMFEMCVKKTVIQSLLLVQLYQMPFLQHCCESLAGTGAVIK